jgi:hypothetical protein
MLVAADELAQVILLAGRQLGLAELHEGRHRAADQDGDREQDAEQGGRVGPRE